MTEREKPKLTLIKGGKAEGGRGPKSGSCSFSDMLVSGVDREKPTDWEKTQARDIQEYVKKQYGIEVPFGDAILIGRHLDAMRKSHTVDTFLFLNNKFPHLAEYLEWERATIYGESYSHVEIVHWKDEGRNQTSIGEFVSNRITANLSVGGGVEIDCQTYRIIGVGGKRTGNNQEILKLIVATPDFYLLAKGRKRKGDQVYGLTCLDEFKMTE